MQTGAVTVENSMEVPQKVKNGTALPSSNCTTRYSPKGYKNTVSKNTWTLIFIAALSTIAKYGNIPNVHRLMNG